MEITFRQDTFMAIFGKKGSGKSWKGAEYQEQYAKLGLKTVTLTPFRSLKDKWNPRVTCYLDSVSMSVKEQASLMLDKIMMLGNYTVFLDESHMVFHQYIDASTNPIDLKLSAFVRHSRHRNVGCFFMTQRPVRLYSTAIAQSDYVCSFRLKHEADLKYLSENCSPEFSDAVSKLNFEKHEYAIYDMNKDVFEVFKPQ